MLLVGGLDQGVEVLQLLGGLLLVGVAQQVWEDGLVVTQVVTNWHSYWLALSCAREIQASTVQEIIRCRCFPVSQLRQPLPTWICQSRFGFRCLRYKVREDLVYYLWWTRSSVCLR